MLPLSRHIVTNRHQVLIVKMFAYAASDRHQRIVVHLIIGSILLISRSPLVC